MSTAAPASPKTDPATVAADALKALCADYDNGHIARRFSTEPTFAVNLRRRGMMAALAQGLPHTRMEEWRFTPITRMLDKRFATPSETAALPAIGELSALRALFPHTLVIVDGFVRRDLSNLGALTAGAQILSLREALTTEAPVLQSHFGKALDIDLTAFAGLNTALFTDGVVMDLAPNTRVEQTLHILHVSTGQTVSTPRHLIRAQRHSAITVVESFIGPDASPYLVNSALEVFVEEGASVDHYRYQVEGSGAFHFQTLQARQASHSQFSTQSYSWGGSLVRNDLGTVFDGPNAVGTINGLYHIQGDQLMDNHTRIDHAVPHCESHELYRGILDGNSRGVFNGRIFVRQDAQKTNALQTNKNLLLSTGAQINTNPQLEIFADDVKCTHGATVGQLDPVQLYYLRSRGIDEVSANRMLTFAFANDLILRIAPSPLRRHLELKTLPAGAVIEEFEAGE
jgi:Fe-S cluster assembly protein SufD